MCHITPDRQLLGIGVLPSSATKEEIWKGPHYCLSPPSHDPSSVELI